MTAYIYGIGLAIFVCLGLFAKSEYDSNALLKIQKQDLQIQVDNGKKLLADELKKEAEESARRITYTKQLEDKLNENNQLMRDANLGIKRVYIKASCPVPTTSTSTAGIETNRAELDPATRQDLFDLRAGIIEIESKYGWCQQELIARE